MSAYVISEVTIVDKALADRYRALAADSIARYGGRQVVRGGGVEAVEGDWPAAQLVIVVEFPTMARAHEWYRSAEYAEALALRDGALRRRLLFVEGIEEAVPAQS